MRHWTETDRREIENFIEHKISLEQQLARDLVAIFNSGELIRDLREMVRLALDRLRQVDHRILAASIGEERYLSVWGPMKYGNLPKIAAQLHCLTAEQCSDIIRLYGAVVEKGAFGKGAIADKEEYRPRGNLFWSTDKARIRQKPQTSPMVTRPWLNSVTGAVLDKTLDGRLPHGILLKQAAGLRPHASTVFKIDKVFGLPVGADISGTTADSIYFINEFGNLPDPIYQLLPVATLVWAYHHALLEVAATLTLNGLIDYTIGCYTSLLPHGSAHAQTDSIHSRLQYWEDRIDNKHLQIYYSGQDQIAGCFQFQRADLVDFRKIARVGVPMWNCFSRFESYPTEQNVLFYLQVHGLRRRVGR